MVSETCNMYGDTLGTLFSSPLYNIDESFLVLYKELRFRHIYAKHKVNELTVVCWEILTGPGVIIQNCHYVIPLSPL